MYKRLALSQTVLLLVSLCVVAGLVALIRSTNKMVGEHPKSYWVKRLSDPNAVEREDALNDLQVLAMSDEQVVNLIVLSVSDRDERVRQVCAFSLGEVGGLSYHVEQGVIGLASRPLRVSDRRLAFSALQTLLQDQSDKVRDAAANSLARCGPEAMRPALELVESSRYEVRRAAVRALGISNADKQIRNILDQDAGAVATAVISALNDSDEDLRRIGILVMRQVEFGPREVKSLVPVAISLLDDDDEMIRRNAAQALQSFASRRDKTRFAVDLELSEEARSAIVALTEVAKTESSSLDRAHQALKALGVDLAEKGI